jgi:hypothetical protein
MTVYTTVLEGKVMQWSVKVIGNNGYALPYWRIRRPIYYEGVQWAVTRCGLENVRGPIRYDVSWDELRSRGLQHWLDHLSEKTWVDVEDLNQAFKHLKRRARAVGSDTGSS